MSQNKLPAARKVVWVVGASSGIGEGIAKEYSARGAFVVLTARRAAELERVRSELASPGECLCIPYDVTDFERAPEVVADVLSHVDHVDVLVNAAGIDFKDRVDHTPLPIYQRLIEVNYYGNIALTLALLPTLGSGDHIVAISSVNGLLADKCSSAYAAAKHALHGFYDSLRAERQDLTISVVAPGYVATPITLSSINGQGKPFGSYSEASLKGMPVDVFSRRVVDQLTRRRSLIVIGGISERVAVGFHRWFPQLFYRVVARIDPEYENTNA